ncbi:MAG: hypothetical protein H6739_40510 [Alphaproteobacteria bacterium]|nr:hypothetical protein [Alphaproteobacteria bacterium]
MVSVWMWGVLGALLVGGVVLTFVARRPVTGPTLAEAEPQVDEAIRSLAEGAWAAPRAAQEAAALLAQEDHRRALDRLERAISRTELPPDAPALLLVRGLIRYRQAMWRQAFLDLQRAYARRHGYPKDAMRTLVWAAIRRLELDGDD